MAVTVEIWGKVPQRFLSRGMAQEYVQSIFPGARYIYFGASIELANLPDRAGADVVGLLGGIVGQVRTDAGDQVSPKTWDRLREWTIAQGRRPESESLDSMVAAALDILDDYAASAQVQVGEHFMDDESGACCFICPNCRKVTGYGPDWDVTKIPAVIKCRHCETDFKTAESD